MDERAITIESGDLRLEGMLHEGDGRLAAVMLHPHPQYGGDMDNHVVTTVCRTLALCGATTLRFNFRGTGQSDGRFDNGDGEADDARAAISMLRSIAPAAPLVLAGYSFGAVVAAGIAAGCPLAALALISPPVALAPLPPLPDVPTLLITGEFDEIAPPDALAAAAAPGRRVAVVPGAGHAWWPGADRLSTELSDFAALLTAR